MAISYLKLEKAARLEKICEYVFYLKGWDYNLIHRNQAKFFKDL